MESADGDGSHRFPGDPCQYALPLYVFRRPYGYDVYLVSDPDPNVHQRAKVHLLDRNGYVEMSVWFRTERLWAAIFMFAIGVFIAWGSYYYRVEISYRHHGAALLALASAIIAVRGFREVWALRDRLEALFPEARPSA
ncbi:MAG: hypothetical protein R3E53_06040 [Myxococcota bacterium]